MPNLWQAPRTGRLLLRFRGGDRRTRTAPLAYGPRKKNELVSLVAQPGVVPYGRYKNLPLETRAKEHFSTGELNAKMRSKKVFGFGVFLVQWESFLNRILVFDSLVEKRSLARVSCGRFLQRP